MERIDFFGSAVFVPVFLVSVGLLLDPGVMVQAQTLRLAGLFILGGIGGKLLASLVAKLAMGYSSPQAVLVAGLTIPQAAATLAATVVGFNIGLFDQSVVNASLVLILVSIVFGTLLVERTKSRVPRPVPSARRLGQRVLVALEDHGQAELSFAIAARLAGPDAGVVRGVLACSPVDARSRKSLLSELSAAGFAAGVDVEPRLMVHTSLAEGVLHAAVAENASLVLIGQRSAKAASALGTAAEAVAAATPVPVAIILGRQASIDEVELIRGEQAADADGGRDGDVPDAVRLAAEIAARLGGSRVRTREPGSPTWSAELSPGQLSVAPTASWQLLAFSDPPEGAAVVIVLQPGLPMKSYAEALV